MDSITIGYEGETVGIIATHGPIRVAISLSPNQAQSIAEQLMANALAVEENKKHSGSTLPS